MKRGIEMKLKPVVEKAVIEHLGKMNRASEKGLLRAPHYQRMYELMSCIEHKTNLRLYPDDGWSVEFLDETGEKMIFRVTEKGRRENAS